MTRPIVALVAGFETTDSLVPLLVALRRWCGPHAAGPGLGAPDAYLAASPHAPGLDQLLDGPAPVAVFAESLTDLDPAVAERADVIIVRDPPAAARLGAKALVFDRHCIRASDHPPITPFVRSRWRTKLTLPDPMFVRLGVSDPWPGSPASIGGALAVCTAAAVRGPWLLTALALGTPVITDAQSATGIGAEPGVHLLTAPQHGTERLLDALAGDRARATSLGNAGRLLVEESHDLDRVAMDLLDRLGIGPPPFPDAPLAGLDAELAALGTPDTSPVAIRALRRASTVAGPADWSDLTGRRR